MIHKAVELGDKIEISRIKLGTEKTYKNEIIYISIIQDIKESSLIISAPVENGKIIPLEVGTVYMLSIYTKGGVYRCKALAASRYKKKDLYLVNVEIKSQMEKCQRRQYYRLNCALSFQFANVAEEMWYTGIIVDISGGGIRFTSRKQMPIDSLIKCKIDLDINGKRKKLELEGSVLLSELVDYQVIKYENRVMFKNISKEDREIIIKFIFDEERKRRKRKKGL